MKMMYERPVMSAEMYMTNSYCNICGSEQSIVDGKSVQVGQALEFFHIGAGGNKGSVLTNISDFFKGLVFQNGENGEYRLPMTSYDDSTYGQNQYYWTTTGTDNNRYYLEYSVGNTKEFGNGDDIFVLYKEDTTNSYVGNKDGLDVNFSTFPGSETDQDNDCGYLLFDSGIYDDALFGMRFGKGLIENS